jgi:hypothetical protein
VICLFAFYGTKDELKDKLKAEKYLITAMRRLTTEMRSEKCIVRRFRRRSNFIDCKGKGKGKA